MKKKICYFVLILTFVFALLCVSAYAEVYTGDCGAEGSNVTYKLDTETGLLEISGSGKMKDYFESSIPWWKKSSYVKNVKISEGVTSIGEYAFFYCSVSNIEISDSVTSIGFAAFCLCRNLVSIKIPAGVTSIGNDAFYKCSSLEAIEVDNNQFYCDIDGILFSKDLKSLIKYPSANSAPSYSIPNSITSIGGRAFDDCISLESIVIPSRVTSIGYSAFYGCSSLTSVTIPDSVTSIGDYASILAAV